MRIFNRFNISIQLIFFAAILLFFSIKCAISQTPEKLSYSQAVEIALKNNLSISIATKSLDISANNASLGNAGFLPKLDGTAQQSFGVSNTHQEYLNGNVNDKTGATSNSFSAGLSLNWTLFDGMGMFNQLDKLNESKNTAAIELKIKAESVISQVFDLYYSIAKQAAIIALCKYSVEISTEQDRLAKHRLSLGAISKQTALQSTVYLNTDISTLREEERKMKNLQIALKQVLGLKTGSPDMIISDTLLISLAPAIEELLETALQNNSSIILAKNTQKISDLNTKIASSSFYPDISLFANLNYQNSSTQSGFAIKNENLGLTYGINLSYNIFNGFTNQTAYENSIIREKLSSLEIEDTRQAVESELRQAYNNYEFSLETYNIESANNELAFENLKIADEQYRLGAISLVEMRQAQLSAIDSQIRLVNAKYNIMYANKELQRIAGMLIQ
jgi:outer membrane protein TolC